MHDVLPAGGTVLAELQPVRMLLLVLGRGVVPRTAVIARQRYYDPILFRSHNTLQVDGL